MHWRDHLDLWRITGYPAGLANTLNWKQMSKTWRGKLHLGSMSSGPRDLPTYAWVLTGNFLQSGRLPNLPRITKTHAENRIISLHPLSIGWQITKPTGQCEIAAPDLFSSSVCTTTNLVPTCTGFHWYLIAPTTKRKNNERDRSQNINLTVPRWTDFGYQNATEPHHIQSPTIDWRIPWFQLRNNCNHISVNIVMFFGGVQQHRRLTDKRMPSWRHRYFISVGANRAFCTCEDTSSGKKPPDGSQPVLWQHFTLKKWNAFEKYLYERLDFLIALLKQRQALS